MPVAESGWAVRCLVCLFSIDPYYGSLGQYDFFTENEYLYMSSQVYLLDVSVISGKPEVYSIISQGQKLL